MFCQNGEINGYPKLRRDLIMEVDPDLFPFMQGNVDTETAFFLALTFGLEQNPVQAMTRMIKFVEATRVAHQAEEPFRGSFAASDGNRLVVARWISPVKTELPAPSLFYSAGSTTLHVGKGYDSEVEQTETLPDDAQLVVSEPLELYWSKRTWHEIPAGTIGVFELGVKPVFSEIDLSSVD